MPVDSKHPEYISHSCQWSRCRDAVDGTDAVKAAGDKYLPRLSGQDANEYVAYVERAMFYGAASRTVLGLSGAVMSKPPKVTWPESLKRQLATIGNKGESLEQVAKEVVVEILSTGRIGALVDAPSSENAEPKISLYYAENIINWKTMDSPNGDKILNEVVLFDSIPKRNPDDEFDTTPELTILVLRLRNSENGELVYSIQRYYRVERQVGAERIIEWAPGDLVVPTVRGGGTLDRIPFIFGGVEGVTAAVDKPPILDLVDVVFSHYRTSADLEHGRHFTALPTVWLAGFNTPQGGSFKIGSTTAWVAGDPNAKAGFLEFHGTGLQSLENALKEKERIMAVLGARLLEDQKTGVETAEAIRLRHQGEHNTLASIARNASQVLSSCLGWCLKWMGQNSEEGRITLNQDFNPQGLPSDLLTSYMELWQGGAMSWDVLYYNLEKGEVYPEGWTREEEKAKIAMSTPERLPPPTNPPVPDAAV